MNDQDTFKSVSVFALRRAHEAVAEKALNDDNYLPIFQELDDQLREYESTLGQKSAIELAREKLRRSRR